MQQVALLELPGVGPKLLERLERSLGGRDALRRALDEGDVVSLSSVTGLSRNRAVRIVQAHRGEELDWLRTDHAEALGRDALEPFLKRAVTPMAKAVLETLAPTTDAGTLKERLAATRQHLSDLEGVDLETLVPHLRRIQRPTDPRPKPVRDVTVFVDDQGPLMEQLRESGLDRWCDVASDADIASGDGLVLAATMRDPPRGAVHVTPGEGWEVVPWEALAWAETNRNLLEALHALAPHLGGEDPAGAILHALQQDGPPDEDVDIHEIAAELVKEANAQIEQDLEDITLSGKDLLNVMQGGTSHQVDKMVDEAGADIRKRFQEATGLGGNPFTAEFPIQVDERELEHAQRAVKRDQAMARFQAAVEVARVVEAHREAIPDRVRAAVELDRWQAVARASRDLGLSVPDLGKGLAVEGALHLELAGEGQPVDYPVPDGVALLTGANSGGKTTLLETLGQVVWLAHLGLPVPAAKATVPVLDGLAFYARPRQLGAGAFEAFLRTIEPMLLTTDRVLVLADELEAMTELEAATAILAEVVARLQDRGCPSILVTHLAPFLLPHVRDVRVDGIEASGLDDGNSLVVDRTPKIGEVARSTPELILQRLRNEADGERADLYDAMLGRLARDATSSE